MNITRTVFLFIVTSMLSLSACRTSYFASTTNVTNIKKDNLVRSVSKLVKPEKMWQISYTLDIEKEGLTVEGKVRIIRDSLIWMTVTKLGLEAMRMQMTQDSVWILDRLKNKYFVGSYSTFERFAKIPFDFKLCQSVLLNEPFEELIHAKNLTVSDSIMIFRGEILKPNRQMSIEQRYFLPAVYLEGFHFSSDSVNITAEINYDYSKELKVKGFKLETTSPNLPAAYFRTKEIEVKDKLNTKFKIPQRYEKIHFE